LEVGKIDYQTVDKYLHYFVEFVRLNMFRDKVDLVVGKKYKEE
jgi:hypothetical protein